MIKGGLGGLMKQAQKMQADMQKAQEELANMEVTGQAGGGMVTARLDSTRRATAAGCTSTRAGRR